jgi:5-methylcytosine-specific restriction endonuclease McrA
MDRHEPSGPQGHSEEGDPAALEAAAEAALWQTGDDDENLARATTRFHLDRAREELGWKEYPSTRPCPSCGGYEALIGEHNGQNVVRCRSCRSFIYNAPKTETGQKPRTVATIRQGVKPGQQVRILERDGACVLCGSRDGLTIGHGLSWKDAQMLGEVGPYLNTDENLFAMCEGCNAGLGGRSVLPKTYHLIVLRLLQAADRRAPARASADAAVRI